MTGKEYPGFRKSEECAGEGIIDQSSKTQSTTGGGDSSSNGSADSQISSLTVPDFLPPAQRVLFMRIHQKQQEDEEKARRLAEVGAQKDIEGLPEYSSLTLVTT